MWPPLPTPMCHVYKCRVEAHLWSLRNAVTKIQKMPSHAIAGFVREGGVCLIHYARAHTRIVRPDMHAHTYIKFVNFSGTTCSATRAAASFVYARTYYAPPPARALCLSRPTAACVLPPNENSSRSCCRCCLATTAVVLVGGSSKEIKPEIADKYCTQ